MNKQQIKNTLYAYASCDFKFRQALKEFEETGEIYSLIEEFEQQDFQTPLCVLNAIYQTI